jgi:hypothetical protein
VGAQSVGLGDEEGVSQDVRGVRGDDRCSFFTISGNFLTVGVLTEDEERAGILNPHQGVLQEGLGEGGRNFVMADFVKALWQWYMSAAKNVL